MQRHEPLGGRRVDDERLEVAVVDADHRRARVERALELRFVADFDQQLEPEVAPTPHHLGAAVGRERAGDQQRGRGAERARLEELDRRDVEVLLEHRQRDAPRGPSTQVLQSSRRSASGSVRTLIAAAPPAA